MNTLNIVTERKAQILAKKLINKLREIINQISNTYNELLTTISFSVANKCNKQFKDLLNKAIYYIIVADNLTVKYSGELLNSYFLDNDSITENTPKSLREVTLYTMLKDLITETSYAIKIIH